MRNEALTRRAYWVAEIGRLSGSFGDDIAKVSDELRNEIGREGLEALLDHLRLCGAVPEQYGRDSSEEKLYSKYTDALVRESFRAFGLRSALIEARAGVADVQARGRDYSLVSDAKAFRLSRTAKNQKDFKVQAMDGWRNGLDHAVLVCPIYQLPTRRSQIYLQAIARHVCILSYSHLAALVGLAHRRGPRLAEKGLGSVLKALSVLNPSNNAVDYWTGINRALLGALGPDQDLWTEEKTLSAEVVAILKQEALTYLLIERDRILGLSREDAVAELIRVSGVTSRIQAVKRVEHGRLLEAEL
jgi:type II restriction enzyme